MAQAYTRSTRAPRTHHKDGKRARGDEKTLPSAHVKPDPRGQAGFSQQATGEALVRPNKPVGTSRDPAQPDLHPAKLPSARVASRGSGASAATRLKF